MRANTHQTGVTFKINKQDTWLKVINQLYCTDFDYVRFLSSNNLAQATHKSKLELDFYENKPFLITITIDSFENRLLAILRKNTLLTKLTSKGMSIEDENLIYISSKNNHYPSFDQEKDLIDSKNHASTKISLYYHAVEFLRANDHKAFLQNLTINPLELISFLIENIHIDFLIPILYIFHKKISLNDVEFYSALLEYTFNETRTELQLFLVNAILRKTFKQPTITDGSCDEFLISGLFRTLYIQTIQKEKSDVTQSIIFDILNRVKPDQYTLIINALSKRTNFFIPSAMENLITTLEKSAWKEKNILLIYFKLIEMTNAENISSVLHWLFLPTQNDRKKNAFVLLIEAMIFYYKDKAYEIVDFIANTLSNILENNKKAACIDSLLCSALQTFSDYKAPLKKILLNPTQQPLEKFLLLVSEIITQDTDKIQNTENRSFYLKVLIPLNETLLACPQHEPNFNLPETLHASAFESSSEESEQIPTQSDLLFGRAQLSTNNEQEVNQSAASKYSAFFRRPTRLDLALLDNLNDPTLD